jgi:uncharacterized membrane protein YqaE (UPF0057 family)
VSADGNLKNAMFSVKRFALCVALAEACRPPMPLWPPVAAGIIIENLAGIELLYVGWTSSGYLNVLLVLCKYVPSIVLQKMWIKS